MAAAAALVLAGSRENGPRTCVRDSGLVWPLPSPGFFQPFFVSNLDIDEAETEEYFFPKKWRNQNGDLPSNLFSIN
jgi:hypothetical protein